MKLKSLKYSRKEGEKAEWILEGKPKNGEYGQWCTFDEINLIVGQNATGKTNTLQVITELAELLSSDKELAELSYNTAHYEVEFSNQQQPIVYVLIFKNGTVLKEQLFLNGESVLERDAVGTLVLDRETHHLLTFKPAEDKLLVPLIRQALQLPLFDVLYQWGKSLTHYRFGSSMGKNTTVRLQKQPLNLKKSNAIVAFENAKNSVGNEFVEMIKADMAKMNYSIANIGTAPLKLMMKPFNSSVALFVKETDLNDITDQSEMSQGLFRVLSLIVQLNQLLFAKESSCILIDDIGEGIDYGRAKCLIDLIINKAKDSSVQLFMTTNDRFVMNNTPLEYWSIIHRIGQKSLFYNCRNSEQVFDEFELTGLSHFHFFSSNYFLK